MRRASLIDRLVVPLIPICAALICACPSLSHQHTARPVPVGDVRLSGAVSAYGFDVGGDSDWLPQVEGQVRYGLAERMDVGLKGGSNAVLQADLNYALVLRDDFVLSVDPTLAVLPVADILIGYAFLPVMVDVLHTERTTLTLSARYGYLHVEDLDDDDFGFDESLPLLGFGASLRWQVAPDLALMPEFQVLFPADDLGSDERFYALSLGFQL